MEVEIQSHLFQDMTKICFYVYRIFLVVLIFFLAAMWVEYRSIHSIDEKLVKGKVTTLRQQDYFT